MPFQHIPHDLDWRLVLWPKHNFVDGLMTPQKFIRNIWNTPISHRAITHMIRGFLTHRKHSHLLLFRKTTRFNQKGRVFMNLEQAPMKFFPIYIPNEVIYIFDLFSA